ncbi:hypothetical protein LIA77_06703 [Sarocladium implicatum]|nr:hypothetical protein LIA77_06703 [Sarocladium implicatum]
MGDEDMLHGLQRSAQPTWNVVSYYRRYRELCMNVCAETELRGAVITPVALKRLILKYGEIKTTGEVNSLDQTDTANHSDAIVCSSKEEEVPADDVCPQKFVYPVTVMAPDQVEGAASRTGYHNQQTWVVLTAAWRTCQGQMSCHVLGTN